MALFGTYWQPLFWRARGGGNQRVEVSGRLDGGGKHSLGINHWALGRPKTKAKTLKL